MRKGSSGAVGMGILLAAIALPCRIRAEESVEGAKFNASASISPNGKWLVLSVSELETTSTELAPELTITRETGKKLYRVALSAKKPRVTLLHETRETDVRGIVSNNLGLFANALVLDDGTAVAVNRGTNLGRWNAAAKFSEHRVFKDSSFRQLSLVMGGRKLVATARTWGSRQGITSQIVDLKTHQASEARYLNGLLGESLQWTPDMKHVYGLEAPATAVPAALKERLEIPPNLEGGKLVRISTQGEEKSVIAAGVQFGSMSLGKNVIVYSGKGKDGAETFFRVKKGNPPVVEAIPGLKTWTPVIALDEDRFLLRSGTDRHGIVTFSAAGDEAARTPPVELLTLPPHDQVLHSSSLKAFVLTNHGLTCKLVDAKGAELWQIQLGETAGKAAAK